MIDISKHITMAQATHSNAAIAHGIKNIPNVSQIKAMQHVAQTVFEPTRAALGNYPIDTTSFFRCDKLNDLPEISGAKNGHPTGECIDAKATGGRKNADIFNYILKNLPFDQLIWEFGTNEEPEWVHFSLRKGTNRHMALKAVWRKVNGKLKKTYLPIKT